ncbi:hypothetical protein BDB01DRAFT_780181 [Pilobolus umbonatus]|nr:hypothetical protein BDB01DRAFT_780181 [Pilobolus umbonatus]
MNSFIVCHFICGWEYPCSYLMLSTRIFNSKKTLLVKRSFGVYSSGWNSDRNIQLVKEWKEEIESNKNLNNFITHDEITPSQINLLANTLNDTTWVNEVVPEKGSVVPPCWHHVYFPPRTLENDLAADGYETDFFPPKPYSQRMWVGASMTWSPDNKLRVGDKATMTTSLHQATPHTTRMGDSVLVWINKDIENKEGWSMREQRCLIYHPELKGVTVTPKSIQAKKEPDFMKSISPTSILLFRYSALTFNSHKIHFDHLYASEVENHPACLVHGPLSGTFMVNLLGNNIHDENFISYFEYKCLAPLYVNRQLNVCGRQSRTDPSTYELWITNEHGHLAVKGSAKVSNI